MLFTLVLILREARTLQGLLYFEIMAESEYFLMCRSGLGSGRVFWRRSEERSGRV